MLSTNSIVVAVGFSSTVAESARMSSIQVLHEKAICCIFPSYPPQIANQPVIAQDHGRINVADPAAIAPYDESSFVPLLVEGVDEPGPDLVQELVQVGVDNVVVVQKVDQRILVLHTVQGEIALGIAAAAGPFVHILRN